LAGKFDPCSALRMLDHGPWFASYRATEVGKEPKYATTRSLGAEKEWSHTPLSFGSGKTFQEGVGIVDYCVRKATFRNLTFQERSGVRGFQMQLYLTSYL